MILTSIEKSGNDYLHSFQEEKSHIELSILPNEALNLILSFVATSGNPADIQATALVNKEWNLWSIDAVKKREHSFITHFTQAVDLCMKTYPIQTDENSDECVWSDIYEKDKRILNSNTLIQVKSAVQTLRNQIKDGLTECLPESLALLQSKCQPHIGKSESITQLFDSARVYRNFYTLYHTPEDQPVNDDQIRHTSYELVDFNVNDAIALANKANNSAARRTNYKVLFDKLLKKRQLTHDLITIATLAHTTIESADLLAKTCIQLQKEGHADLALALVPVIVDRTIKRNTFYKISMNLAILGNTDKALELANQHLTTRDRDVILLFIYQAYQQKGDLDQAVTILNNIPEDCREEAIDGVFQTFYSRNQILSLITFIKCLPEDLRVSSFEWISLELAEGYKNIELAIRLAKEISDEKLREETFLRILKIATDQARAQRKRPAPSR